MNTVVRTGKMQTMSEVRTLVAEAEARILMKVPKFDAFYLE